MNNDPASKMPVNGWPKHNPKNSLPFSSHWTNITSRRNFLVLPVSVRCAWHALVDLAFREAAVEKDHGRLLGAAKDLRLLARTLNLPAKSVSRVISAGLAFVHGDDLVVIGLKADGLEAWGNELPSSYPDKAPTTQVLPSSLSPAQQAQRIEAARRGAAARWRRPPHPAIANAAELDAGTMPENREADAGAMPENGGVNVSSGMDLGGRGEEDQEDKNSQEAKNTNNLEHTHPALTEIRDARAGTTSGMRGDAEADAGAGSASPHAERTPEATRADARAALARFLRRQGLPAVRATPNHPDPVTEWADLLQGVIGARSKDEGLAALGAMLQEAKVRGLAVQFARHVASLASIGQAEIRRFRARAPPG